MRFPTRVVGTGALVTGRVVSTQFCRLLGIVGYNNSTDTFIQIHETASAPADGAVPVFAFPADAARSFSFALPSPVDLSACYVCASSTLATKTAVGGTTVTIQGILAS